MLSSIKKWWMEQQGASLELPGLQQYVQRGIRFTVLTGPVVVGFMWCGHWLYGGALWGRTLAMGGAVLVLSSLWALVVYLRPPRDPTWPHVFVMSLVLAFLSFQGWCHQDGLNPFTHGSYVGYVAMTLACPMRWSRLLALGLSVALAESLAAWVTVQGALASLLELGAGTLTLFYCVLGASMVRALWRFKEDAQHQLLASDRLSTLGRHTAGIAHELKTPLASASNGLYTLRELGEELRESLDHPEVNREDLREIVAELLENAQHIEEGLRRTTRFVTTLREHTQQMHHSEDVWFAPQERFARIQSLLRHLEQEFKVTMRFEPAPQELSLFGDPGKFDQVVINLVTNAMEACSGSGGGLWVEVSLHEVSGGVLLVVQDNGPGVPEALREDIFKPLFTTRGDEGGTGLGLAMCRDIIQGVFGGELALVASEQGARFEARIPLGLRARVGRRRAPQEEFKPFSPAPGAARESASGRPAASS